MKPNVTAMEAVKFVQSVAALTKDGEDDGRGEYVMENDEAYDTLHDLISQARDMLGLPLRLDPKED